MAPLSKALLVAICCQRNLYVQAGGGLFATEAEADVLVKDHNHSRLEEFEGDATWVLTSSFVILTMQSGFGLLESGSVGSGMEVNVMMKNVIDVVMGGVSYWMFGYGLTFGNSLGGFMGISRFFVSSSESLESLESAADSVDVYSHYIFQFTFSATATTIVSGSVAGRMKFSTYMIFSFVNTALYCIPAHWTWSKDGWLYEIGFVDFAGDGPVHLLGGVTAAVGALMVGPRDGRFDPGRKDQFDLENPLNCIFGLFMLWWGWLGFNCGSTYGVTGHKWLVASRVAVMTINASIGGGLYGISVSYLRNGGLVLVDDTVNAILAGLVAITAGCAAFTPLISMFVGVLGAFAAQVTNESLKRLQVVDDPVGAIGVHGSAAAIGLLCVGIFADPSLEGTTASGVISGGGLHLLGIQAIGVSAITVWTWVTSFVIFKILDWTIGLRVSLIVERAGLDFEEHGVKAHGTPPPASRPCDVSELETSVAALKIELTASQHEVKTLHDTVRSLQDAVQELQTLLHDKGASSPSNEMLNAGSNAFPCQAQVRIAPSQWSNIQGGILEAPMVQGISLKARRTARVPMPIQGDPLPLAG